MEQLKPDYVQMASGCYLTDWFPDNHNDLSDEELLEFIAEHIACLYEGLLLETVLDLIIGLAETYSDIAEEAVRRELAKGQIFRKKTITHGNPDMEVGGLVTVDYIDVTFRVEDWYDLTS